MLGKAAEGHHGHAVQGVAHGGAGQAQVHAHGGIAQQLLRAAHGRHGQAGQLARRPFDAAKGEAVAVELDHGQGGRRAQAPPPQPAHRAASRAQSQQRVRWAVWGVVRRAIMSIPGCSSRCR
jgi:hypothetical protein